MEIAERTLNYFDINVSTRRHITLQFFIKSGEPSVPTSLHYWPYIGLSVLLKVRLIKPLLHYSAESMSDTNWPFVRAALRQLNNVAVQIPSSSDTSATERDSGGNSFFRTDSLRSNEYFMIHSWPPPV